MPNPKDFTFKQISDALLDLRASDMNYMKVCADMNIKPARLRLWQKQYAEVIWAAHPVVLDNIDDGIKAKREKETEPLRDKATEVTEKLLKKILNKINADGRDVTLSSLTNAFKEVAPYILPKFDDKGKTGTTSVEQSYEIFMEKIYSKINGHVNEKTTIKGIKKK